MSKQIFCYKVLSVCTQIQQCYLACQIVDFIYSKCQNSQKEKLFWTFLIYNPHLPYIMYAVSYQNWPSSTFKVLGVEQHILQFTSQTFHLAVNQLCIYSVVNTVVLKTYRKTIHSHENKFKKSITWQKLWLLATISRAIFMHLATTTIIIKLSTKF